MFLQAAELLAQLECRTLQGVWLYLERYPGCTEPTAADWGRLDSVLQQQKYSESTTAFYIMRQSFSVEGEIVWGDWYPDGSFDGNSFKETLQNLLPGTCRRDRPVLYYAACYRTDSQLEMKPVRDRM